MPRPLFNRLIFVLALVGVLVAGYLWALHNRPEDIVCGPSSGCGDVARSPYSRFPFGSGPPVAMYGTLGYLAIATLAFLRTLPSWAGRNRPLVGLLLLGSGFGTAASLGLTYLEIFKIHALCKWCIASQFIISAIFLLALADGARRPTTEPFTEQSV